MSGYYKLIITTFLIVSVIGYSSAEERKVINQLPYESHQLIKPKLHLSIKSSPRLINIPSLTLELASQTAFSIDEQIGSDLDSGQYALSIKPIAVNIESLYEKYGFNDAVENFLHFYSSKKFKEKFLIQLSRMGKYLAKITEIFRDRNLPQELVFLPLIESGFNLNARSPKKAVGLWQFIPGTAKRYGLKIDWWVDERLDPIKATMAAAEYLSNLYEIFGSWNLALAAYNAGEGKILKALERTKSNDFWELRKTKYIKKETKNYVPSYIAATAIALNPERFGFENVAYHSPLEYDEVVINSPMSLKTIAKLTGADVKHIKELNPELRQSHTPPNVSSYTLRIPAGTKETFLSLLPNVKEEELLSHQPYKVKKGDTVKKIARLFGVSAQSIIELNSLGKKAMIKAGSTILIPSK